MALRFEDVERLLDPDPMPLEMGIERLDDGVLHVAVRTLMTGCTGAMFQWWFGWGPLTREYAWWHPGDHGPSDWLDLPEDGSGIGSTHVVEERLGGEEMHPLRIRFHDPVEIFGGAFAEATACGDVSCSVTANTGFGHEPPTTEDGRPLGGRLVHVGRDTAFGLQLRSHFWLGWGLPGPAVPDEVGLGLVKHSHAEWLYLARFLPALFIAERRDLEPAPGAW
jgi:hypothetical protein